MNDSLIPYQGGHYSETAEESVSRQFYEWEERGRGWLLCNFPVEIEPPFRPFYLFDFQQDIPAIDDGRHESFFNRLFGNSNQNQQAKNALESQRQLAAYREQIAELDEPLVCDYHDQEFEEIQLVLPKELKITKSVSEQFLLSLSYCSHPVSFEIIGTSREIIVQMAATGRDLFQLKQQLKAHVPQVILNESTYSLLDNWRDNGSCEVVVDFGLSREFMLPLNSVNNLETDPLVAIVGALSSLQNDEVGVFQVLFQKTQYDWAEEMLDAVRTFDGTPFFINAPEMIPLTKEKVSRPLFSAVIRVAAKSYHKQRSLQIAKGIGAGLLQLSNPTGNELIPLSNDNYPDTYHEDALLDRRSYRTGMILNSEELVSLVHPPSANVRTEKLVRESEKTKPAPALALYNQLVLGDNFHQNETREVSLSNEQRTRHIHVIGASGSGKSSLLLNLIKQDLEDNQGLCVIDPHGDLIDDVLGSVPESRIKDVILFDPSDSEFPIGFNILKANSELEKTILSSDLIATFRRMSTSWGDVMDSVLANAILAFVESSRGGTLFELKRFLVEKEFRTEFLKTVNDEAIRYFWMNEFPLIAGKPQSSILIRLDAFLRQKLIRNIVCQKDTKLNFREIMDNRKILLIKLSQGLIGEENAYLLGTFLVSKLYQTALSRQDSSQRPYFWLYMDEFHNFITPSMESVLSGVRKYNLGLILAHQEFRQLNSRSLDVAASVLSNCYTRICFRLGDNDAERFANGFSFFDQKALQNLGVGEAIARIERSEYDFNLKTYPVEKVAKDVAEQRKREIVHHSRETYATALSEVEAEIFSGQAKSVDSDIPADETAKTDQRKGRESTPKTTKSKPEKQTTEKASEIGNEHRYLQSIIKRIGENYGFVATIEKQVFGGVGKIDVTLENEILKIACEIASTNTVEYELQNIQKCLATGFDKVAVVSSDTKHLGNIQRQAKMLLTPEQLDKLHFLEPESFHLFLENISRMTSVNKSSGTQMTEQKVKGYKIRTEFKEPSTSTLPKQSLFDIIKGAFKRKGKKE